MNVRSHLHVREGALCVSMKAGGWPCKSSLLEAKAVGRRTHQCG